MIREALEYIVSLRKPVIEEIEGRKYSDKSLNVITEPLASEIEVSTLSGLIKYVKSGFDTDKTDLLVHIISPTEVKVFDRLNKDKKRNVYIHARAELPRFQFDQFHDLETMNIKLQSNFIPSDTRDVVLKIVGNVKEEAVKNFGDDGITQTVTAKIGLELSAVKVPNPVSLAPYRTFVEVEQPESNFVLRMREGSGDVPKAALFEADGGVWSIDAKTRIEEHLQKAFEDELAAKKITIIA